MTHGFVRVAAIALVLSTACSKADNRAADSAAGASAQAQTLVAQPQRPPGPGELTKPLADYTGDELNALVQSLQYAGANTRARRCQGLPGCGGGNPTQRTRLLVEGVVGEDSVSSNGTQVPRFGVIVSRGRNLGGARDAMYGMRPGNRYQYFMVVLPDTGNTARWQIEQLETVGNSRTHSALAVGRVQGCNHPWTPGAKADFRTCAQAPVRGASTLLPQQGEDPWWYGCQQGCCISTQFGGNG